MKSHPHDHNKAQAGASPEPVQTPDGAMPSGSQSTDAQANAPVAPPVPAQDSASSVAPPAAAQPAAAQPFAPEPGSSAAGAASSPPKTSPPPGGVYNLDPTVDDAYLDASGRIDWHKAMSATGIIETGQSAPSRPPSRSRSQDAPAPAAPSAPATSPSPRAAAVLQGSSAAPPAPAASDREAPRPPLSSPSPAPEATAPAAAPGYAPIDWANLPGAHKVIQPRPGHAPRHPHTPSAPKSPRATPSRAAKPAPPEGSSPASERQARPAPESYARSADARQKTEDLPPPSAPPSAPSTPSFASPATPVPEANGGGEAMSRYDQLRRAPSMKIDPQAVQIANEFADILFHISRANQKLASFREKYPYLIAPNVFGCWEDNLKECTTTMLREFQTLKNGPKKSYDKKFICKKCHSVFFVSLPDGICDECRGNMKPATPTAPY